MFDSGLGGLLILKAIREKLPQYDYVFYGDTKNLPYGNKTQREIFDLTVKGIELLIDKGCILIIIACNTASAKALRKIQQQWLPKNAPNIKVLGVVVPTIETLNKSDFPTILMATGSTVKSKVYGKELNKIFPKQKLIEIPAPELVPLLEEGKLVEANEYAIKCLSSAFKKSKSLILGCTHYPLIKKSLIKEFPKLKILDQTELIPKALKKYLRKHIEIRKKLSTKNTVKIIFNKTTKTNKRLAKSWFK